MVAVSGYNFYGTIVEAVASASLLITPSPYQPKGWRPSSNAVERWVGLFCWLAQLSLSSGALADVRQGTSLNNARGCAATTRRSHPESKTELRYGTKGSLSVRLDKGVWHDHENQTGGGVVDLIKRRSRPDTLAPRTGADRRQNNRPLVRLHGREWQPAVPGHALGHQEVRSAQAGRQERLGLQPGNETPSPTTECGATADGR